MPSAAENYRRIRQSLPPHVVLVVAAKGRSAEEVADVVAAGAAVIGHNHVQAAEQMRKEMGARARAVEWHLIGHLQRNKVNRALPLFDVIQSVDSTRLARAISERAERPVRVLVEVNVGGEDAKWGVAPEEAPALVEEIGNLANIRVEGLMAIEPYRKDPDDARPYFRRMRRLFDDLKARHAPSASAGPGPGVQLRSLSMGMTHSYHIAVEEGSNMVRIGTAIFGPRSD